MTEELRQAWADMVDAYAHIESLKVVTDNLLEEYKETGDVTLLDVLNRTRETVEECFRRVERATAEIEAISDVLGSEKVDRFLVRLAQ